MRKILALFIVAILILLFSLIYTFILFIWHWRLPYQDRKVFKWIKSRRLYHFVEPYHAPYVPKHRYWTGLLLFIRIALYLTFALNVSSDPGVNLFAIVLSTACIFFLKGLYGEIYKNNAIDKIEMICYLNLDTFSAMWLYLLDGGNQMANYVSTYISGAITFVLLFGIIIYHVFTESRCKGLRKWKRRGVAHDNNDRANCESSGHSLVKTTCSIVIDPRGVTKRFTLTDSVSSLICCIMIPLYQKSMDQLLNY